MEGIKSTTQYKNKIKRKSEILNANKIRLNLLLFEKNEIKQKKALVENCFSFSNKLKDEEKVKEEKKEKEIKNDESKLISKKISLSSRKSSNDSSHMSDIEKDSSSSSCSED